MATPFIMAKCFYISSAKMVTLISHLFYVLVRVQVANVNPQVVGCINEHRLQ